MREGRTWAHGNYVTQSNSGDSLMTVPVWVCVANTVKDRIQITHTVWQAEYEEECVIHLEREESPTTQSGRRAAFAQTMDNRLLTAGVGGVCVPAVVQPSSRKGSWADILFSSICKSPASPSYTYMFTEGMKRLRWIIQKLWRNLKFWGPGLLPCGCFHLILKTTLMHGQGSWFCPFLRVGKLR